jgi:hypothetical protein
MRVYSELGRLGTMNSWEVFTFVESVSPVCPRNFESVSPVCPRNFAAVPGAAEQRGELASFAAEGMEHRCEFLREQEEPAIGSGLLFTQRMEDATHSGESGGDAARRPGWVRFGE